MCARPPIGGGARRSHADHLSARQDISESADGQLPTQQLAAVRAVHPNQVQLLAEAAEMGQKQARATPVLDRSGSHGDSQQPAQGVHQHVALTALDLLAFVIAAHAPDGRALNALAVETACRRMLVAASPTPDLGTQRVVDPLPGAIIAPAPKKW
jgi:hypothetical protein